MTRLLLVDRDEPNLEVLDEAAAVLRTGGLVAFPTETVYGLGADATNPEAVARIFLAKGRPPTNPLILHVAKVEEAQTCVATWPEIAGRLAARFWPGPLTLVLPKASWVPEIVTAGRETVGIRIPQAPVARQLISRTGRPLAAPSANRSTGISPTEARHVLKDLEGKIDLILDAGPTSFGLESTVLDLSGPTPVLLRPGRITLEALSEALDGQTIELLPTPSGTPASYSSPGQMEIHYAPRTPTWIVEGDRVGGVVLKEGRWAVVIFGEDPQVPPLGEYMVTLTSPELAEERLYATLHQLDEGAWDGILLVAPQNVPPWRAIRDRIRRAGRSLALSLV